MSVEGLDELDNIIFSEDIYNSDEKIFLQPISNHAMYQSFKNSNLSIRKNSSTGFISIGIKHQSPKTAKEILSLFIDELDAHFRENKRLLLNL